MSTLRSAKEAIVTVDKARGFITQCEGHEVIITAAHCLPHLPPAYSASGKEKTYVNLLGALGGKILPLRQNVFSSIPSPI